MNADALRAAGIVPKHWGVGPQRLPCPRCAETKYRPRDDALSLLIEPDNVAVWNCFRCQWAGSTASGRRPSAVVIPLVQARAQIEHDRHTRRAEVARAIWRGAAPAPAEHPYLARKLLPPDGLRYVQRFQSLNSALLVAMRDSGGEIVNLQAIDTSGEKRFLSGAKTCEAFACIGPWVRGTTPQRVAVGEGYATAASFILQRPAYLGVAAMSAGNLPVIGKIMRDKFPAASIAILCDQDQAGVRAATLAQLAARADFIAPGFRHAGVKDFSDLWVAECTASAG